MLFRKRKQLVMLLIAGVLIGGFVFVRYLPLRRKIQSAEQANIAQRAIISRASMQNEQIAALKQNLLELQKEVGNYDKNVPAGMDIGVFLGEIADLMDKHGLKEQIIQPGEEAEAKQLNCIPVIMKCKGKLLQVRGFYKSLQELDRSIRIEQFRLSNDRDFKGDISMETEAIIYYRTPAEQS